MSVKVWQHSNHLTRQHKKDKHDTGGDGVGLIRRMEKRKKKKERRKKQKTVSSEREESKNNGVVGDSRPLPPSALKRKKTRKQ